MNAMSKITHKKRSNIATKVKWTPEEDEALKKAVKLYDGKKWRLIAAEVPGRTSKQCLERWYGKLNPDLLETEFSKEEDQILIEKHEIYGNKWSQISKFLKGRSTIAVRNRWDLLKRHERNPSLDMRHNKYIDLEQPKCESCPAKTQQQQSIIQFEDIFSIQDTETHLESLMLIGSTIFNSFCEQWYLD